MCLKNKIDYQETYTRTILRYEGLNYLTFFSKLTYLNTFIFCSIEIEIKTNYQTSFGNRDSLAVAAQNSKLISQSKGRNRGCSVMHFTENGN